MNSLALKSRTFWFWATIFLLASATGLILTFAWRFPYAYDDAFISFRIAEHFQQTGLPFLNIDQAVYTNTSLAYPVWNGIWFGLIGPKWTDSVSLINGAFQVLIFLRLVQLFYRHSPNAGVWFLSCFSILPLTLSTTQLATGNSGLETSLYQVVIVFGLLPFSWKPIGWLAGLVRPEGFLVGVAHLFSLKYEQKPWVWFLIWGVGIFLVWLGLAWFWFETPIPQSILAKASYDISRWDMIRNGYRYLFLQGFGFYTLLIATAWFSIPELRNEFRPLLIWLMLYTLFFSVLASWWPWYVPPLLVPIQYMAGRSVMEWWKKTVANPWSLSTKMALLISFFIVFTTLETQSAFQRKSRDSAAFQVRVQSSKIIGEWLKLHVKPKETVLVEPLGLIGYFSEPVSLLDYPGLANPEMSRLLHNLPWKIPIQMTDAKTDSAVLSHFHPDWLLLFPYEIPAFQSISFFSSQYQKLDSLPYYPNHERFCQAVFFKRLATHSVSKFLP